MSSKSFAASAYSDPENDFVGILLTQRLMESPQPPAVFEDFWMHAYRFLESFGSHTFD